jgi:hypothetical protein
MAWTPGLVLDYARLLQIVVEPGLPALGWLRLKAASSAAVGKAER